MFRTPPLASCLCLTFGRPHMLREAIWCFLQQDYPHKELIVINDHPNPLMLDRDYPGVQVHNVASRFNSLGEKRNYSVRLARGAFLLVWDDDDLFLPWRISQTVTHLQSEPQKWAYKPTRAWTSVHNRDYRLAENVFHSQLGMTRAAFTSAGGYSAMNTGEDVEFEQRIPAERWIGHAAPISELIYVYRWGNTTHVSGYGLDRAGQPTGWDLVGEALHAVPGGVLTPGFASDHWHDLLQDAARNPAVDPAELDRLSRRLQPYLSSNEGDRV